MSNNEHDHDHDHEHGEGCGCGHDHPHDHDHGPPPGLEDLPEEQRAAIEAEIQSMLQALSACVTDLGELPPLLPTDHPLLPTLLDRPDEEEARGPLLQHAWEHHFTLEGRVPILRAIDARLAEGGLGEESQEGLSNARVLLLRDDKGTQTFTFQLAIQLTLKDMERYQAYWYDQPAPEAAVAALSELRESPDDADKRKALLAHGRDASRAIAAVLEDEYNEISDDYDALEAKGIDGLVLLLQVLGELPGHGSAFLLLDYLTAANHPAAEKAARAALVEMADEAREAAFIALLFDDLEFAARYVIYDLIGELKEPYLPRHMMADLQTLLEGDATLDDDDWDDMLELALKYRSPCLMFQLVAGLEQGKIDDSARARIEAALADHGEDPELVEARRRVAENLPLLYASPDDVSDWIKTLTERWGCENDDERVQEMIGNTPAFFNAGYTYSQVYPPEGPKALFLDKICAAEVEEQVRRGGFQLPPGMTERDLRQFLISEWYLTPRSETGRRAPAISIYREQREQMPDDEHLLRSWFLPTYYSHLQAALQLVEQDNPQQDVARTHVDIASRFLDDDDRFLAYVKSICDTVKPKSKLIV